MKEITNPYAYRVLEAEGERKRFFQTFAVSSICHLMLFAILIFSPEHARDRRPALSFINVSIVTVATFEKGSPPKDKPSIAHETQPVIRDKKPPSTTTAKEAPVAVQKPSEAISIQKKTIKTKRSLKKETFKTAKVVESAIEKIEKRVEASRPDQITQAIDRLKDQVKNDETVDPGKHRSQATATTSKGIGAERVLELVDLYRVEIAYQVQKNWAFSEQLAGAQTDLMAELAFRVMPNGEIRDIWFDKRSGNKYLDDSAQKAIMKSNPVPPHPAGIRKPYVNVGLRFTPKGVQ